MSRRLSNIEWVTFQNEVDVDRLYLPPWGGVVQWRGMNVLVYTGPSGEVFLTDVSDLGNLDARFTKDYDPLSQVWWYHVPEEGMLLAMSSPHDLVNQAGNAVVGLAEVVGEAAGGVTKPLLENLTVPLVIAGVLGIVLLAKR